MTDQYHYNFFESSVSSVFVPCLPPGSVLENTLKFEQRRTSGRRVSAEGSCCTAAHFCPRKQSAGTMSREDVLGCLFVSAGGGPLLQARNIMSFGCFFSFFSPGGLECGSALYKAGK